MRITGVRTSDGAEGTQPVVGCEKKLVPDGMTEDEAKESVLRARVRGPSGR